MIAVVGPPHSLAVGAVGGGASGSSRPQGLLRMAVGGLAGANLLVGALNLIPGLPLDGGRILKAGVWGISGNPGAGLVAGWAGRVTAVAFLGWPLLIGAGSPDFEPTVIDFALGSDHRAVPLVGGDRTPMASARLRSRLPSLVARNLARRTLTVPGDLPLGEAVRRAQAAEAGGS